jgi:hypothetical protein
MRQAQRDGDVAEAAVHADDAGALRQRLRELVQRQARQHGCCFGARVQAVGNRLAEGQLGVAAMWQGNPVALRDKPATQFQPIFQWPLLVGARGAMHKCYRFRSYRRRRGMGWRPI